MNTEHFHTMVCIKINMDFMEKKSVCFVKTNRLDKSREVTAVYFVKHMKHTHTQMTLFSETQSLLMLHEVVQIHTIYL
jgi:hypothetical protein